MLRELGIRLVTLAIGFAVMVAIVPGVDLKGTGAVLLSALVYMVLNATLGLVLKLLTAPLAIVTLGLSLLAVNAVVLVITAWIVDGLNIDGVGAAILGTLWLTLVSFVLELVLRRMNRRARRR
jgi:putative membrane protein